jgi:NTP pyrophosphatase (non-canonical NTP hydrolase)
MSIEEFIRKSEETDLTSEQYFECDERLKNQSVLVHFTMGLSKESGEVLQEVVRHVYHNQPLDPTKLVNELGDCFWYLAGILRYMQLEYKISLAEILEANYQKTKTRYPNGVELNSTEDCGCHSN